LALIIHRRQWGQGKELGRQSLNQDF
jgi:hypothetical protein